MADVDDPTSLPGLFVEAANTLVKAQQRLDQGATDSEIRSGTRFWLNSIPALSANLEFGLTISKVKKFLFIPRGRSRTGTRHRLSFALRAAPAPVERLRDLPDPDAPLPMILEEPSFLLDRDEEKSLGWSLLSALGAGRWRAVMPKPNKLNQGKIDDALQGIQDAIQKPDSLPPGFGLCAFRLDDDPPQYLVVYVTDDEDHDGVFLMNGTDSAIAEIYTYPKDGNDDIFYQPLARLNLAVQRWLAGTPPRRRFLQNGLPARWGLTTLDIFARNLFEGCVECTAFLADQALDPVLPELYALADVAAELNVTISYARDRSPKVSISGPPETGTDLIDGRVQIGLAREGNTLQVRLTLLAPGFILTGDTRAEFIARARSAADDIAGQFDDLPADAYAGFIRNPPDSRRITIFLARDKDKFRFLVTWPAKAGDGSARDFVFTCAEAKDGRLTDIKAVIQVTDDIQQARISAIPSGTYKVYNRFFQAVQIWRAGVKT